MKVDTLNMFVSMRKFLEEGDYIFEEIKPHVSTPLAVLQSKFKNYFPEQTLQQHKLMRN